MNRDKYLALGHAMQTGVAIKMQHDPSETQPKHLRVGVNSAMCDSAALAGLLIAKGLITEAEYLQAVTDEMEREVGRYEEWCREHIGPNVHLA